MPSTLTWLDHDPAARERSLRILAFFRVRDSRDELGLGAIRDSFSDKLFPGTSTIQNGATCSRRSASMHLSPIS